MRRALSSYRLPSIVNFADEVESATFLKIVNDSLTEIGNRLDTLQQLGAKPPVAVTSLTVTGKQGLFYLTWQKIANVDGYVILQASDSAMTQISGRWNLPDGETVSYQIPVGNVAVTNFFTVQAYQGNRYGPPSTAVSGTTVAYGSGESAPPAPPQRPVSPKVTGVRNGTTLQ